MTHEVNEDITKQFANEKYLFIMCVHTEVNNVGSKTGKAVLAVRSSTESLCIGVEFI